MLFIFSFLFLTPLLVLFLMGIIEAYKALKDIKYRVSTGNKPLQVIEADRNHVMICKGDTCFEFFRPEIRNNRYIIPVIKWKGNGNKFKSMEKKYISVTDLNYYTNTGSFEDFVNEVKKVKEIEQFESNLYKLFDY
jgi:hypothetical protein